MGMFRLRGYDFQAVWSGAGEGTLPYISLYGYVLLQRVWFSSSLVGGGAGGGVTPIYKLYGYVLQQFSQGGCPIYKLFLFTAAEAIVVEEFCL